MDVNIMNPFLGAAVHVLKTMAHIEPKPGKPYLKKDNLAFGDVSAIIGITGDAQGSMALTFTEPCIKEVLHGLIGIVADEINEDVRDAVGELTNMICGNARGLLGEAGIKLQAGIPTIVTGKNHCLTHIYNGPRIAMPFTTPHGDFVVELAFNK